MCGRKSVLRIFIGIGIGCFMVFFGKTLIVLVDTQELRRVAFTNLFSSLLSGKNVLLLDCNSVDYLDTTHLFPDALENTAPLFILSVGGLSLNDPQIAKDVAVLRAKMPKCLVMVLLDADWNGDVELAMSLAINGIVYMSMPPQNVIAAIEIALMGGTYFPKVSSAEKPIRASIEALSEAKRPNDRPTPTHPGIFAVANSLSSKTAVQEKLLAPDKMAPDAMASLASNPVPLSRRQVDVLKTLQSGLSNKEIARALGLSEATIKIHVRHLMRKFGVVNRTQVAVLSRQAGTFGQPVTLDQRQVPSL